MFLETNPHKSDYSQYFTNFAAVHLITLRLKSDKYIANSFRAIIGILVVLFAYSCANIGTPNGGPYDELPPKFISSVPTPNTVNYKGKKVEILFDELIQIEKASENVIITPPQMEMPVIRTEGKKIVVELEDSLKSDATYTIDFTNSISDNNEKNVLQNYSFAFSTGGQIDTMEVSGTLLNAENLEPVSGIIIGLHSNLADSAFVKLPFERTSRTNDRGHFTIRNIKPGKYRIYALNDVSRTYKFDQPSKEIAWSDSLIIPSSVPATRQDTTWKDTSHVDANIDTIKTVGYTRYLPDDIVLRLFKENYVRQYMTKPERPDARYFTLRFNAPLDSIPVPVPMNFTPTKDSSWYYPQKLEGNLGVNYWLTDPRLLLKDTLQFSVTYPKSDSLNVLHPQTDTLQLYYRKRPAPKKKKLKEGETEPVNFLGMQVVAPSQMDVFDTISVTFDEPVLDIKKELFHLEQKVDTVWKPSDFDFFPDSTNSLKYFILRKWKYGEDYHFDIDSASIKSIYGKWNDKSQNDIKMKKEEDYGNIYISIANLDTTAYMELVNNGDVAVRKVKVKDGGALFMDLKPDKYFARLVIDLNNNGKWDPGNYAKKQQPEEVFYYPKMFEVKAFFNYEEDTPWNFREKPLDKLKPLEVTKNKPKEETKKKRNYKDEGKSTSKSSNPMGGMGGGMSF